MQKTKLGISVNLLAAIICLAPLTGGYVFLLGLVLYVLLAEKNEWLKKTAIKVLAVTFVFGVTNALLELVPGVISVIDSLFSIFRGSFRIEFVSNLIYAVEGVVSLFRRILLIAMSLMALSKTAPEFGPVDRLVRKHTEDLTEE